MRLLLSGFQPFGGSDRNPSLEIVQAIAAESIPGVDLRTIVLPVETETAAAQLIDAWRSHASDAIVMLGEAAGRAAITPEAVAINLRDFEIADNAGRTVSNQPVIPDGPTAYFTTLPIVRLIESMRTGGVPAHRSLSAGTYLCNELMYRVLHEAAMTGSATRAGFIHVPRLPEQCTDRTPTPPSMSLDLMVSAIRTAIDVLRDEPATLA
jgi:pyroglutamyl-peptidase